MHRFYVIILHEPPKSAITSTSSNPVQHLTYTSSVDRPKSVRIL